MGHKLIIKCKTIKFLEENIGKKSSQSWARQKKKKKQTTHRVNTKSKIFLDLRNWQTGFDHN